MTYKYFTDKELKHGRQIPEGLENNIIPTARVLDALREEFGKPITILSSYRSPEYNKKVGGALRSMHLLYNALDFYSKGGMKEMYDKLKEWDTDHKFDFLPKSGSMGIGLYPTFIHLDTRATCGRKSPSYWII